MIACNIIDAESKPLDDVMSDERGHSGSVLSWFFWTVAGPVIVFVVVIGSVFIENKTFGTHHIESTFDSWHIDVPFHWVIHITRLDRLPP